VSTHFHSKNAKLKEGKHGLVRANHSCGSEVHCLVIMFAQQGLADNIFGAVESLMERGPAEPVPVTLNTLALVERMCCSHLCVHAGSVSHVRSAALFVLTETLFDQSRMVSEESAFLVRELQV
jgi:hypothetical protein